jgi:hypothetical protein
MRLLSSSLQMHAVNLSLGVTRTLAKQMVHVSIAS